MRSSVLLSSEKTDPLAQCTISYSGYHVTGDRYK
jgi:hypothetical protein